MRATNLFFFFFSQHDGIIAENRHQQKCYKNFGKRIKVEEDAYNNKR